MVTDSQQPSRRGPDAGRSVVSVDWRAGTSRAQLILVGAIVLAVVIVGLSVVANSFFATASSGSVDVSAQSDAAVEFDYESRRGLRSLLLQLNHRNRNLTESEYATAVDDNVTGYSRLLSGSYVRSDGVAVNLTYHNDNSEFGRRLVQAEDAAITDDGGNPSWDPVSTASPSDRRQVGRFVMNVDLSETSLSPAMTVEVRNGSESVRIELSRTTTAAGEVLQVRSEVSYAGPTETTCAGVNDRVLLDLETGDSLPGDCEFHGVDALTGPVSIEIGNGDSVVAKYGLVVNGSLSAGTTDYDTCRNGPDLVPVDEPCTEPVVWTANVTTRFAGSEVQYVNSLNMTVYEGPTR